MIESGSGNRVIRRRFIVARYLSSLPRDRLDVIAYLPNDNWPYLRVEPSSGTYRLVDAVFSIDCGMHMLALAVRFGDSRIIDAVRSRAKRLLRLASEPLKYAAEQK